jgi:serine/threonine-protein kinase HipA
VIGRHFVQTGEAAGLPKTLVPDAIAEIADTAEAALASVENNLPANFPDAIHNSVKAGVKARLRSLRPTGEPQ